MKTPILACAMALMFLTVGCNKDDDKTSPLTATEIKANADMDNISDDVSAIAESESDATSTAGRGGQPSFLSGCAQVITTISGNTWTRIIDFGATNCTLYNGNSVRGKIIIVFSDDFDAATRTINYSFENFYHNNRHVEGNRTVGRTIVNGHPRAVIDLNLTVTTPQGAVYQRTGQRVRDFVSGFGNLILSDNQFSITGSWVTTFPSGTIQSANIIAPLIVHWDCAHIMSGSISFTRNNSSATAVLDYGNGSCDDMATLTINGNVYPIDLGI
ncbi:MAG TPA: hypothetical protein PLS51_02790 [Flavobacterium sp.]|nr:hypothetical protein [Flavobacterium sp.]HPJ09529.1 hypothetical protein [Flavobacterium sp.]